MFATCKDLARIALAFAHTSMMLSLPYRSPKTWDLLQFVRKFIIIIIIIIIIILLLSLIIIIVLEIHK